MSEKFDILPDVADKNRDLQFRPVDNPNPNTLSSGQVIQYNQQGFIAPLRIFDQAQIIDIRNYFDNLLDRTVAAGGNSYSISSAHLEYGRVYDLLTHERIVSVVKDLLGENVVGWGSHFFCKMPGDGKAVAWHQDASYWPLSPSGSLTVWLAVDAADRENGCMQFLSGSQHGGHLIWRPSRPEEHNVLNQTVDNVEQYGEPVDNLLRAGEVSLHSDLLLHGSGTNHSNRRRCGLTLRYAPVGVRASQGWNTKGVVLSGTDPDGHWANPSRPKQD
jgi:ectoine hydroxylase-related dioxygenase (phytanoyl-CoA dioxygenase family)